MARNKFLTTIAGLLSNLSNHRKSPTSKRSGGYVYRQKGDGDNDLTRYLTKYFKNFTNFSKYYQSLLPSTPSQNRQNPSRRWRRLMRHKLGKSFMNLLQTIGQLGRYFSLKAFYRLWRNFLLAYRQRTQAGFVLPVTVLMVVMILLIVTSLMFRSYQRSEQVIGAFQTQQLQNAATPAIERAKAKLERLFSDKEGGLYQRTSGLPNESIMEDNLLLKKREIYTFPDEAWIKLDTNGDGSPDQDAGWTFKTDTNGDGDKDDPEDLITAYTIVFRATKPVSSTALKTVDPKLVGTNAGEITFQPFNNETEKANNLVVSNGPILPKVEETTAAGCQVTINPDDPNRPEVSGWFSISSAVMMKNFQVYAVSVPQGITSGQGGNAALSTVLYQQDRTFSSGNKWGAWFRNDIEINPGFDFIWNGAIHTEGSIFTRPEKGKFRSFLIGGKNSCFYRPETNSQITARGHFVNSLLWGANSAFTGQVLVDRYSDTNSISLTDALDSVLDSAISGNAANLALNALKILTQNASQPRGNIAFADIKDTAWDNQELKERVHILQASSPPPYVDDTYRADNIYGPKPGYGRPQKDANGEYTVIPNLKIGERLTEDRLIRDDAPVLEPESYGLDGYWERRARGDGMRVIVGQRLELGNAYGWKGNDDPLYPPNVNPSAPTTFITNLSRQRRAQRDNLAAVQATLVYHNDSSSKGYEPVAVVATTVHPGTKTTLENSATFEQSPLISNVYTDFFYGIGTNGWEFDPKSAKWNFAAPTSNAAMKNALSNLANFAGDPDGAFPPKQENGGDIVHPYPYLTMWGNFSNLRRALEQNRDSLADKTTIQTAAATLGLLAYNVDYLQKFDYNSASNSTTLSNLKSTIQGLTLDPLDPPDKVISLLGDNLKLFARLVHLKEQVERDRKFGFAEGRSDACLDAGTLGADQYLKYLCSDKPKFPALYYIFPTADHGHDGQPSQLATPPQPSDLYITNNYIKNTVNPGSARYKKIDNIADLALKPRAINFSDWALPTATSPVSGTNPVNTQWDLVLTKNGTNNTLRRVALKDSAFFDGREEMNVRALNLDLDLLRMNDVAGGTDTWLPKSGIIYAFREDAVREDAIARPRRTTYSSYETSYLTNPGIMDANNLTDPPVYNIATPGANPPQPDNAASVGISPKPVDFYADPDRRPYGFRLKQGNDLRRKNQNTVLAGLTLVSDNPVYIQGNFNGHGNNNQLTELTRDATGPDDKDFYSLNRANNGFGNPEKDPWRPAEVLADAVTLLSNSFCDGSVEDAYRLSNVTNPTAAQTDLVNRYGCVSGAQFTSYLSQNRPNSGSTVINWARENSADPNSPILFSRNGVAMTTNSGPYNGPYHRFSDVLATSTHGRKTPIVQSNGWANLVMVSGNVPSRNNQGNGGMHNFPRLLERWNVGPRVLKIRGSFIQLNFSNYATSPYERDAWEPRSIGNGDVATTMQGANCNGGNPCQPVAGTNSTDGSNALNILFYAAPGRDWGYDVGLQYMPSGPVSKRLVVPEAPRSEFYREPRANNPYICQLRRGINFPCNP